MESATAVRPKTAPATPPSTLFPHPPLRLCKPDGVWSSHIAFRCVLTYCPIFNDTSTNTIRPVARAHGMRLGNCTSPGVHHHPPKRFCNPDGTWAPSSTAIAEPAFSSCVSVVSCVAPPLSSKLSLLFCSLMIFQENEVSTPVSLSPSPSRHRSRPPVSPPWISKNPLPLFLLVFFFLGF